MESEDYDHLDVYAANLKVENCMDDSMESQHEMENSSSGQLQFEILNNLDVLKQQTKQIFEQSRDFKRILKEKDDKIKVLMDLNFTLQLENRELKQQLEGNTSNFDLSLNKSSIQEFQDEDVESTPQKKPIRANEPKVELLTKKQLFNLSLIEVSEDNDSKYIQKLLFSLYTPDEINGISVSGKPTKNPKYHTPNQPICKPISPIKLQYIYYMMEERVDNSGCNGQEESKRKSRQLINKFINRAIQFVKRNRKKREERNQAILN